jgi:hypothetical protein
LTNPWGESSINLPIGQLQRVLSISDQVGPEEIGPDSSNAIIVKLGARVGFAKNWPRSVSPMPG